MFQSQSPIDQENDLASRAAAAPTSLPAQEQAQILDGAKGGNIAGRFVIANRMAFRISFVLGKDTPQIRLAGLGAAVLLFAFAPGQFFLAHAHSSAVAAGVHIRRVARFGRALALLPLLGTGSDHLGIYLVS